MGARYARPVTTTASLTRAHAPWVPTASWAVPLALLSVFTSNPGSTVLSVLSLALIVVLLWRRGEPPTLLFVCGFQWLQACLSALHADSMGIELRALSESRSMEAALSMSACWTIAMALGSRAWQLFAKGPAQTVGATEPLDFRRVLTIYLVWTAVQPVLNVALAGSTRQISVALGQLRWGVLFALFTDALRTRRHLGIMATAFCFEVAAGFLSFFSEFKTPIYVLALALPAVNVKVGLRHAAGAVLIAALALYLAVVWSAIKMDYRDRISGYTGEQVILVDTQQQVSEFLSLVGGVDERLLVKGWTRLLDRLAYIEFFAYAIDFVPAIRPHEEGRIWWAAFQHVLMPRVFFPGKPGLESDTTFTERYTGLQLTNTSRSSSIALGSPGESYVDFGWPGMLVPAFLIGMLYAVLLRMANRRGTHLLDLGMGVAILLPLASLERSSAKILGGVLTTALILLAIRPVLDGLSARRAVQRLRPNPTPATRPPPA